MNDNWQWFFMGVCAGIFFSLLARIAWSKVLDWLWKNLWL